MFSRKGPTVHTSGEIKRAIEQMVPNLPVTAGYRLMTNILRQKGMHVRRDVVMQLMRETDAVWVEFRRRRRIKRRVYHSFGPNHVWHIDGYDKMKPFGFPMHGCIDGYSRKIMWLHVGPTNNDSAVIAYNFVNSVKNVNGCPMVLQADPGTGNTTCGAIQCLMRHNSRDWFSGINSFRVVKSKFN